MKPVRKRLCGRRRRVLGGLAIVAAALFVLAAALLARRGATDEAARASWPAGTNVAVASLAEPHGLVFSVTVSAASHAIEGVPVRVVVTTPAGPLAEEGTLSADGRARLVVPSVRAGVTPYRVTVGGVGEAIAVDGVAERRPGDPVEPLVAAVAPKTIRVTNRGSRGAPGLIVHPVDANGNVVDAAAMATVALSDGALWTGEVPVRELVGFSFLPELDDIGTERIAVRADEAGGERAEIAFVPGLPASGTLTGVVTVGPVDGRDPWEVRVTDVRDDGGRRVSDGEAWTITIEGARENLFLTRPVLGGSLQVVLPVGPTLGSYELRGRADVYVSQPLELRAEPPFVGPLQLRLTEPASGPALPDDEPVAGEAERARLEAGPFVDELGAFLDDGFPVVVAALDAIDGEVVRFDVGLRDGHLAWSVPPLPRGVQELEVRIGGMTARVPWPPAPERGE